MKRKIAILIILIIIMIRVFFPRVKYGYRELETIKIYYYNNGNHQIVIDDDKSKKEIYDRIRYSWLTSLDLFYVGDDNGSDGVAIQLLYMNGDSEFFDSCERGSGFTKYIYSSKSRTVKGQMQINSSKLEKTIDKYIENY